LQHNPAFPDAAESDGALAELSREQGRPLHRFLLGLLRDRAAADDVLQQVLLKLVESWPSIRPATARSWLFTVAYHEALALRRRQKCQDNALAELWARPVWQCHGAPHAPEVEAVRGESIEAVRRALEGLPAAQREVVRRRVYGNQTFATIALELDCPLGTVLTRMRLALKTLSQLLED
jgi:RNA polymerase sigma-70 factor (ECF subfamily)